MQISKKKSFPRPLCLTLKELEQSASVCRGLFFSSFFLFGKKPKNNLSNKTRISVKITRKNIHKYMFTIYYVHLHKLFKKVDRRQGCLFKKSVREGSAVLTLENVNTTQRWCCCWRPLLFAHRLDTFSSVCSADQKAGNTTHSRRVASPATTASLQNVH